MPFLSWAFELSEEKVYTLYCSYVFRTLSLGAYFVGGVRLKECFTRSFRTDAEHYVLSFGSEICEVSIVAVVIFLQLWSDS